MNYTIASYQTFEWMVTLLMSIADSISTTIICPEDEIITVTSDPVMLAKAVPFSESLKDVKVNEKTKFTVGDEKYLWSEVMEALVDYEEEQGAPEFVALNGNTRGAAAYIASALTGEDIRFKYVVTDRNPDAVALENNVKNAMSRRLGKEVEVKNLIPLIKTRFYKQASELAHMYADGMRNYRFNIAYMVAEQGVSFKDAMRIPDKKAGAIKKMSKLERESTIAKYVAGTKSDVEAAITRPKWAEIFALCESEVMADYGEAIAKGKFPQVKEFILSLDKSIKAKEDEANYQEAIEEEAKEAKAKEA